METYVKNLVVQLRDSGKSFQDISNILDNEYNIHKSRQAIHGIYNRAIKSITPDRAEEELKVYDILTYYIMGLPVQKISEQTGLSNYKVKQIIEHKDSVQLDDLKSKQFYKAIKLFEKGTSIEEVIEAMKYKGVEPTKYTVCQLFEEYINYKISESIINTLANIVRIYKGTALKEIVKKVVKNRQYIKEAYKRGKQLNAKSSTIIES